MTDKGTEQKKSAAQAVRAMNSILSSIQEMHDVLISDVRELESALWMLMNSFGLEANGKKKSKK